MAEVSEPVYTPQEVEATLEQAVASAESQIEDLIAQEAEVEDEAALDAAAEEAAEEVVTEAAAEAEADAVANAVLDEAVAEVEKKFANDEDDDEDDDEDSDYDDDDFDPADETVLERIEALKDIFSPKQRAFVTNTVSAVVSGSKTLTLNLGSALWYAATTSMLVGVPLAVAILNETQLTELEKELNGAGMGVAAPAAAPVVEEKN